MEGNVVGFPEPQLRHRLHWFQHRMAVGIPEHLGVETDLPSDIHAYAAVQGDGSVINDFGGVGIHNGIHVRIALEYGLGPGVGDKSQKVGVGPLFLLKGAEPPAHQAQPL